jgi:hypothetical protein
MLNNDESIEIKKSFHDDLVHHLQIYVNCLMLQSHCSLQCSTDKSDMDSPQRAIMCHYGGDIN